MTIHVLNRPGARTEVRAFLDLAVPLASAQLAQAAVGFVDTLMMGRLGANSLAAGGLAASTVLLLVGTLSGVVMAVSPLVATAFGAGRRQEIEQLVRQGLWLSLLLGLPLMLVIMHLDSVFVQLGQSRQIASLAAPYFRGIAWGVVPALGFAMLRGYASALSQARVITGIVAIGTGFNLAGNYALGFGKLGFPRLELAGLAIASSLSFWLMFLLFLAYVLTHRQLKQYRFWRGLHRLQPQLLWRLLSTGSAIAVTIALEYGLFTVVTFLMGLLGPEVLAAHQTVYQTMYVIYMVPLGMSYAATARVGQWAGQRDRAKMRQAGYVGIGLAAAFMGTVAIALVIFRHQVIGMYLDISDPANAAVLAMAMPILFISALSQLLDGVQRVAMGALYGLQDMRVPMLLSGLAFWGVGLTSGYVLGFPLGLGGTGLWIGQSIGVAVAGVMFTWRFHCLTAPQRRA